MHRVGEILEASNINQWRWVTSKANPADLATKFTTRSNYEPWFTGPDFLVSDPKAWPKCDEINDDGVDVPELKRFVLRIDRLKLQKITVNAEGFSNWKRLYRAVATFILYVNRLRSAIKGTKSQKTKIEFEDTKRARSFLVKYAQSTEFSEEISYLQRGKTVEKSSKLYPLNIYLDSEGIVRCRGRAEHLNNNSDVIILPNSHHITFLIVRWTHENLHHLMHETIINRVRSQYFISRLRVLYRKVRRTCQKCKNAGAMPQMPQMAALPAARLAAFERPFTYVGVDYFGPLYVVVGRRREKRWGVLFTCLTLRAVHIEIAHSLDTSSCMMSIKNFVARRGYPREIFSDNGTNFKATEKIIRESLRSVKFESLVSSFDGIKWKFNPPGAPHMGGIWERLVRSIKTVLLEILPSSTFNDEGLRCALCEVEFIINARPLTFVSLEHEDDEALTPNHLLLGSSAGYKPICDDSGDLRQRWRQAQLFADRFWRRWIKEYVPIISRRSKWFVKQKAVRIGDIVVIVDQDLPRNRWPKGKIVDAIRAKDGQIRSVVVKTESGVRHRPVAKIAVLDVGNDDSKLDEIRSFTGEGMLPPISTDE